MCILNVSSFNSIEVRAEFLQFHLHCSSLLTHFTLLFSSLNQTKKFIKHFGSSCVLNACMSLLSIDESIACGLHFATFFRHSCTVHEQDLYLKNFEQKQCSILLQHNLHCIRLNTANKFGFILAWIINYPIDFKTRQKCDSEM